MTREAFITAWRDELSGLLCNALFRAESGAALAVQTRVMLDKIDRHLGAMYDQLAKEVSKPSPNGMLAQRSPERKTV
jgi:hypothetical protein